MLYALLTRHAFDINVIHDRNPVFVRMADGAIRNGYTIRILNKQLETRRFALSVDGIAGAVVEIVGLPLGSANVVEVGTRPVARIPRAGQQLRIFAAFLLPDHLPSEGSRIGSVGAGA